MPYPEKGESKEEFISRAVRVFIEEGSTRKIAIGKAFGFWKSAKKKKKKGLFDKQI